MSEMKSNWDPVHYDESFSFVYEYGADLLKILDPKPNERILDLGCGTGSLTHMIGQSTNEVVGLDNSSEMIGIAKSKYPNLNFIEADAADFYLDDPFDAIFSNATLHWVIRYEKCIDSMYRNLKEHGRLVLEFGGKGNISNIITPLRKILAEKGFMAQSNLDLWYFPSIGEYTTALELRGFQVVLAQLFDRPTELQSDLSAWLDMFADPFFKDIPDNKVEEIKKEVQEIARSHCFVDGKWVADYSRIRILAVKRG